MGVQRKQPEAAAEVFRQLAARDPTNRRARYSLASVEMMAHRHQAALDSLQPLIASGDPDPEALALAASAYEAMGDTPNAVSTLRQAIVLEAQENRYKLVDESASGAAK